MTSLVAVSIGIIIYLGIMVLATVFVYSDAKKRNMNEAVWGIVTFFAPFLLGLLIYFVCRRPLINWQCPKCGAELELDAKECPQCKTNILIKCVQCGFPVQKGWKSCPACGVSIKDEYEQPVRVYKKDRSFLAIIGIVLFILIGLFAIFAPINYINENVSSYGYGGIEGMYNISKEELAKNEEITAWISKCDSGKEEVGMLISKKSNTCLVYVKNSELLLQSNWEVQYQGDKCYITLFVEESEYEDKYGYDFFLYELEVRSKTTAEAFVNNERKDVKITFTDSNISQDTWR